MKTELLNYWIKDSLGSGHLSLILDCGKTWNCGKVYFWRSLEVRHIAPASARPTIFTQAISPSQERPYNSQERLKDCCQATICFTRPCFDSPRLWLF